MTISNCNRNQNFFCCHQVIIFQTYTNKSAVPIEAKYVFPLEETAAVCGFEAFINGKHVVGKVQVIQNLSNADFTLHNCFLISFQCLSLSCR